MFSENILKVAKDVLKYITIPDEFGPDEEDASVEEDRISKQLYDSPYSCYCTSGITKLVVVMNDYPFVLKIPFRGRFVCINWDDESDPEYEFYPYKNASAAEPSNYCALEMEKMLLLEHFGWQNFVPETAYLDEVDGYPVYIQEKVKCGVRSTYISEDSLTRARIMDLHYKYGPLEWRAAAIEYYGEKIFCSFINWCISDEHFDILTDLHSKNVGFRYDGAPVILDWGGFSD